MPGHGARVLDAGSGTGTLALRFASQGARVTALDPAEPQLEQAERAAVARGLDLAFVCSRFEDNTLPDASFDLIAAGQCWHWFEPREAARQLARLLAPDGRVLLCSFDWLPLEGSVVEGTEALIQAHNPAWKLGGGDGRHPEWERDLCACGFEVLETRYADHDALYSHESWRGRIRASAGIAASLSPEEVSAFDREHDELLKSRFSGDPLHVPLNDASRSKGHRDPDPVERPRDELWAVE